MYNQRDHLYQLNLDGLCVDVLFEIALYLDHSGLVNLSYVSKMLWTFYEQELRLILVTRLKGSRLDRQCFDVKELWFLCHLSKVPQKLSEGFFITDQHQVYGWGDNSHGRLGLGDHAGCYIPNFIKNLNHVEITQLASGSLFLTKTGQVYACGSNQHGQLGLGDNHDRIRPELITTPSLANQEIIQVSAGTQIFVPYHSLFLNRSGQVYACGFNSNGELGLNDYEHRSQPELITALMNLRIIEVCAGDGYSLFLTNTGQVYICGYPSNNNQIQLMKNLDDVKIIQIFAAGRHNLLLNSRGQVYAYGSNHHGQLGLNDIKCRYQPELITSLMHLEIVQVSGGYNRTDEYGGHSLFLTRDGYVYSCGENTSGQLGLGHYEDQCTPILVADLADEVIVQMSAGDRCSYFLTQANQVYTCGSHNCGQLGMGSTNLRNRNRPELMTWLDQVIINHSGYYEQYTKIEPKLSRLTQ